MCFGDLRSQKVVTQRWPPPLHPGGHWRGAADTVCPPPEPPECSLKERQQLIQRFCMKENNVKETERQSLPWLFLVHRSSVLISIFPKIQWETLCQGSEHTGYTSASQSWITRWQCGLLQSMHMTWSFIHFQCDVWTGSHINQAIFNSFFTHYLIWLWKVKSFYIKSAN